MKPCWLCRWLDAIRSPRQHDDCSVVVETHLRFYADLESVDERIKEAAAGIAARTRDE